MVTSPICRRSSGAINLVEGNGRLAMSASGAGIIGRRWPGAFVQLVSAAFAILLDAISYLVSVVFLWRIDADEAARNRAKARAGMRREIGEGLRAILDEPILGTLGISTGIAVLFENILFVAVVLCITRELGLSAGTFGIVFAAAGVGYFAGAVIANRLSAWLENRPGDRGRAGDRCCGADTDPARERPRGSGCSAASRGFLPVRDRQSSLRLESGEPAPGGYAGPVARSCQWQFASCHQWRHLRSGLFWAACWASGSGCARRWRSLRSSFRWLSWSSGFLPVRPLLTPPEEADTSYQ
ncbi:MAG: hypothetical protein R2849_09950 [Thermomicrobiales bacterium]